MKQSSKLKSILSLLLSILLVIGISTGCTAYQVSDDPTSTTEYSTQSTTSDDSIVSSDAESKSEEVTISSETQELVSDTLDAIENNEDIATNEVIESSESEEATVVDEGALEADAQVEQENVSYDGTNTGKGTSLLGSYQGITYYSQADSRWANLLYTSTGNKSQTMKSSACGPTSAAMIVSSSKGAILPTTMAQLFVDNGYRTANNGTAWACWPFVADYFDFDEYYTTTSDSKMLSYLKTDKNNDSISDYFVVASCNNGLWTTGGHYIVLIGYDDGHIIVFDPYLYNGKFNTASRRAAKVVVSGNSAFVSESSFKTYSNTKQYWIYSNDSADAIKSGTSSSTSSSTSTSTTTKVNYTRYVATQSANLNVRSGPGTNYSIVGSLKKGTKVTVSATSGSWSQIGTRKWVSTSYLSASQVSSTSSSTSTSTSTTYSTSVGKTYKLKSATTLYSKSNLSGTKYQYKANTTVKVLSHASSKVDYVYVVQTGRYAYCPVSAFASTSTSNTIKSTVGQYRTLKSNTTLYSNSNLTGTQYQYLAGTKVKILKNVSSTVDYVQVIKTGRKAHVRVSAYK